MEFIRGPHNLRAQHVGCVATIGNFDGVHRGHQAILADLRDAGKRLGLPVTVILFEPQPLEYFKPEIAPARLTRLREKILQLQALDVDRILCLPFGERTANMLASDFVEALLLRGLGVKYLLVGDDFCFGKNRQGDIHLLRQYSETHDFIVENLPTISDNGERISSSLVRDALQANQLAKAEQLLGRPYAMSGRVAHGDKRGRTIGVPTANIFLQRRKSPLTGVFAVRMHGIGGAPINGVANLGSRPTVDGTKTVLEVHLFDFDDDIYGAYVNVEFLEKIRDEKRFEDFAALKTQIFADITIAKTFFTSGKIA